MANVPNRSTNEVKLNEFNAWMKGQPWYQEFFRMRGLNPNRVKLSDSQQAQLESIMKQQGVPVPSGMHIDPAGNLNQKNTLVRNIGIGAAIGGGALTGLGFAGMGPLAGALGGGSAAAGAGGAAASSIPTIGSTAIGSGLGYGPASLAGTSALAGSGAGAATAIPTIASRAFGGLGTEPAALGSGSGNAMARLAQAIQAGGGGTQASSGDEGGGFNIMKLLAAGLPALGGYLASRGGSGTNLDDMLQGQQQTSVEDLLTQLPNLREMLDINANDARRRNMQQDRADPLLKSAQQLALNLLPRHAFSALPGRPSLG